MKKGMTESEFAKLSSGLCAKMRKRLLLGGEPWSDIESMMTAALGGTWVGAMTYTSDFVEWQSPDDVGKGIAEAIRSQSRKVLDEGTKKRIEKHTPEPIPTETL